MELTIIIVVVQTQCSCSLITITLLQLGHANGGKKTKLKLVDQLTMHLHNPNVNLCHPFIVSFNYCETARSLTESWQAWTKWLGQEWEWPWTAGMVIVVFDLQRTDM